MICLGRDEKILFITEYTNAAVYTKNIQPSVKNSLELRLSLVSNLDGKIRSYYVLGLYHRFANENVLAARYYGEAVRLLFKDSTKSKLKNFKPSTIASVFNNIANVPTTENKTHDSLFIIGRASAFFESRICCETTRSYSLLFTSCSI